MISYTHNILDIFHKATEGRDFLSRPKRRRTQTIMYGRDRPTYIERDMSHCDILVERLERLRYVDEACLDHQAWVTIDPDTDRFPAAERRVKATTAKVERAILRWAAALPLREKAA